MIRMALPLLGALLLWTLGGVLPAPERKAPRPSVAPAPAKARPSPQSRPALAWPLTREQAKEILGPGEEAPSLVLLSTSSVKGEIEKCGCVDSPAGGIARRGTLREAFRLVYPGAEVVWLDAGAFAGEWTPASRVRNLGLVEAMNELGYRAANLTPAELAGGYGNLESLRRAAAFPLLGAGYAWEETAAAEAPFPPSAEFDIRGVRIGVAGIAHADERFRWTMEGGRRILMKPPAEALPTVVRDLRSRCDFLVVLAWMPPAEAEELAGRIEGIDLIVGAWGDLATERPRRVGSTQILYAGSEGRSAGEVDLYITDSGLKPWFDVALRGLTAAWPEEPRLLEIQKRTVIEVARINRETARGTPPGAVR